MAHVSTQAGGVIRRVHVTLGDQVKRSQALVEITSVAIGEAQADYLEAEGMVALTKRSHGRLAALRKEGIASEKELLQAKQNLDAARIRTSAALGKLRRLGMSEAAAQALVGTQPTGRLVLRAPIAGTVLNMHAVAGEIAKSDAPLLTIGDNAVLWVWADLYERDVAQVMGAQNAAPLAASVAVKAFANSSSSLIMSKVMGNLVFLLLTPLSYMNWFVAYVGAAVIRGLVVGLGVLLVSALFTSLSSAREVPSRSR